VLAEDPSVNRLEDTLLLWKQLVSNRLLARVNIVLFLNKCDLLQRKLAGGVRLAQYMTSYRDRPNDFESVAAYFRNKFGAMHQLWTPNKERELHSECGGRGREEKVLISSSYDGGDGHAEDIRAHPPE
jgi:hypothetical protein